MSKKQNKKLQVHNPVLRSMEHGRGHYTQTAWADTNLVGCGYVDYKEGNWYNTLTVCNFGPGGNIYGRAMYEEGEACSKCGEGVVCDDGLCVD